MPAQKKQMPIRKTPTPTQITPTLMKKTPTPIHPAIPQMKVQIKELPLAKNHHPAGQMYSHLRI